MPFCPSCRVEYKPGVAECADCHVPLVGALPPEEPWVKVFEGTGKALQMVEEELAALGIPVARAPSEYLGATFDAAIFGPSNLTAYALSVPQDVYEERRAEIEAAVTREGTVGVDFPTGEPERVAESAAEDPAAMAEAEEDYPVFGCPHCLVYFYAPAETCPGCGAELVPAVDCFAEGQAGPAAVAVAAGAAADLEPLLARYQSAGFHPSIVVPAGWSLAALQLPWTELTDRTREAMDLRGP